MNCCGYKVAVTMDYGIAYTYPKTFFGKPSPTPAKKGCFWLPLFPIWGEPYLKNIWEDVME